MSCKYWLTEKITDKIAFFKQTKTHSPLASNICGYFFVWFMILQLKMGFWSDVASAKEIH